MTETTNGGSTTPKTGKKIIAEWVGDDRSPRLEGAQSRSSRVITRKDAKQSEWEIPKDLRWDRTNSFRQDVTDTPESFRQMLEKDKSFKLTEE
jgi:hypothetical protein